MGRKQAMTIRQKIKLSNVMMALIPIMLTAIIVAVCLQTSLGSYWYTLETMYQDENGIQSAQSLITPINRNCGRITGDRGFIERPGRKSGKVTK